MSAEISRLTGKFGAKFSVIFGDLGALNFRLKSVANRAKFKILPAVFSLYGSAKFEKFIEIKAVKFTLGRAVVLFFGFEKNLSARTKFEPCKTAANLTQKAVKFTRAARVCVSGDLARKAKFEHLNLRAKFKFTAGRILKLIKFTLAIFPTLNLPKFNAENQNLAFQKEKIYA